MKFSDAFVVDGHVLPMSGIYPSADTPMGILYALDGIRRAVPSLVAHGLNMEMFNETCDILISRLLDLVGVPYGVWGSEDTLWLVGWLKSGEWAMCDAGRAIQQRFAGRAVTHLFGQDIKISVN